jgi:hypothetical protein
VKNPFNFTAMVSFIKEFFRLMGFLLLLAAGSAALGLFARLLCSLSD